MHSLFFGLKGTLALREYYYTLEFQMFPLPYLPMDNFVYPMHGGLSHLQVVVDSQKCRDTLHNPFCGLINFLPFLCFVTVTSIRVLSFFLV